MLAALRLSSQSNAMVTRGYIVPEASHHRVTEIAYSCRERLAEQPVASDTWSNSSSNDLKSRGHVLSYVR